jgi:hypothetical protein
MSAILNEFKKKLVIFGLVFLLLGILSLITVPSGATTTSSESDEIAAVADPAPEGTRSDSHKIPGYLELWDYSYNEPHDGVYGDGDPGDYYRFYLDTTYSYFSIYLRNIYSGYRLEYINTTLKVGSEATTIVKVTSKHYNYSYMYSSYVREFVYAFKIDTTARIQVYQLVLDVEFVAVNENYERTSRTGRIYFDIQLSSRIRTNDEELTLRGRDKSGYSIPIYSGSRNMYITLMNAYSGDSTLEDLTVNLNLPSTFTIENELLTFDEFETSYYYNDDMVWLLDDAGALDKTPDKFYGTLEISYRKDETLIKERSVPIAMEIAKTPIINLDGQIAEPEIGSLSGADYVSNVAIYQGSTSEMFSLKFQNDGNLDLKDVKIELFTDNAAFFFKSKFYYDEGNNAYKRAYGKTIELGDIDVGHFKTEDISTEVVKNLPPGLYRIPVKYSAKYMESEHTEIEIEENDVHERIIAARSVTNEGFTPFLLVNVIEGDNEFDTTEPDMLATTDTVLRPGMHNVKLSVELTNLENYRLNNVNVRIDVGGSSPLQPLNEVDRTANKLDAIEKDFAIYSASDPTFGNKYTVHFMVDVYSEASSGVNEVPITITCLDPYNQERSTLVNVPLNINPIPPRIIVIDASTNNIEPDDTFSLKVRVYNCGGCNAKNVRLLFNGSSNLFTAEKSIQGPKNVNKEAESEFEFNIKAGDVEPGEIYSSSVRVGYEDELGNLISFDDSAEQFITLRVDEPKPEEPWTINEGIALVILGLFILVSTLLFGIFRGRISRKSRADALGEGAIEPRVVKPRADEKGKAKIDARFRKDAKAPEPTPVPGRAGDRRGPAPTPTPTPPPAPQPQAAGSQAQGTGTHGYGQRPPPRPRGSDSQYSAGPGWGGRGGGQQGPPQQAPAPGAGQPQQQYQGQRPYPPQQQQQQQQQQQRPQQNYYY